MSTQITSCSIVLEERDYIGLSEALPASSAVRKDTDEPLQDTDLRLELGLGLAIGHGQGSDCKESSTAARKGPKLLQKRSFSKLADDSGASWYGAGPYSSDKSSLDPSMLDPSPPKTQVVGWPPVCAYRKQTLPKPAEMFVKVNMDGMTVGRKVDLSAYSSYDSLLQALEEMFRPSSSRRESDWRHFLKEDDPDFMLTYEDKEGDWMLVGDVPWSMFITAVRRLRITRASEVNGTTAPSRPWTLKSTF